MRVIDLRSDTVTRPSAKMRAAMAAAEVGDDVYGEDPTVNRLEARAAEIFGKEAALFVPTGTMGNTIAIKLHTRHGEEVACAPRSHILDWELSMMAWFAGCIARVVPATNGILTWPAVEATLRSFGPHNAPTTLISLENTHNMAGGTVYPIEIVDEIAFEAHKRGLNVHMDGARIFNASAALNVPVSRITRDVDSVMFCLSKGLGAPVGSLLVAGAEEIKRARLLRKRLGGGMRQAGVLAAAALIALEESPRRLEIDHQNASFIANRLREMPGIAVDAPVETNIVIFDISATGYSVGEFSSALKEQGVLINGIDATHLRILTHLDVTREDCEHAVNVIGKVRERQNALSSAV
ncbi:MAG TPA: GntG family PLP-dependent aldolase [Bryobacteraceae bacterium]|nr:GntG family PLP-dependent aldolase [Bryobacteraceae bacterium]